ncbi:hypothetical protein O181_071919 [Austropuccinia psidii MF-1]|uniref:Uncharacterized protein n=1 Tax=Austropuccinia psidii MF-1 TaxID=1389203 RepID=A0A9Q3F457_9BASI|nr:hypothetical protein [Austropuccinia psidii MF-1]
MSPVHLRDLGVPRSQPEEITGMFRSRRPAFGKHGEWKETQGNHSHTPIHFQFSIHLKTEDWPDIDQVLQLHQLLKYLFQRSLENKILNLASYWVELGASCQKVCVREISFKELMEITKDWNPSKELKLLEERAAKIRET